MTDPRLIDNLRAQVDVLRRLRNLINFEIRLLEREQKAVPMSYDIKEPSFPGMLGLNIMPWNEIGLTLDNPRGKLFYCPVCDFESYGTLINGCLTCPKCGGPVV